MSCGASQFYFKVLWKKNEENRFVLFLFIPILLTYVSRNLWDAYIGPTNVEGVKEIMFP